MFTPHSIQMIIRWTGTTINDYKVDSRNFFVFWVNAKCQNSTNAISVVNKEKSLFCQNMCIAYRKNIYIYIHTSACCTLTNMTAYYLFSICLPKYFLLLSNSFEVGVTNERLIMDRFVSWEPIIKKKKRHTHNSYWKSTT